MAGRIIPTALEFDGSRVYLQTADEAKVDRFDEWVRLVAPTDEEAEEVQPWTPDELEAWGRRTGAKVT